MKILSLEHKNKIKEALKKQGLMQSELNFTNLFAWRDKYNFHIYDHNEGLVIVNMAPSGTYFSQPLGPVVVDDLLEDLRKNFNLERVTFKKVDEKFSQQVPNGHVKEVRDDFDYLYDFEALKALKGNKYHKKKNHINKFKSLYSWTYEKLDHSTIPQVRDFCQTWFEGKDQGLQDEYKAILRVLDHYDDLDCSGGLLKVEGQVIAFTIGEIIHDTLLIHFEKANTNYQGAYTMIMQQYLEDHQGLKLINREQDLGIEGLRKSKMSYHPLDFVKKYNVTFDV